MFDVCGARPQKNVGRDVVVFFELRIVFSLHNVVGFSCAASLLVEALVGGKSLGVGTSALTFVDFDTQPQAFLGDVENLNKTRRRERHIPIVSESSTPTTNIIKPTWARPTAPTQALVHTMGACVWHLQWSRACIPWCSTCCQACTIGDPHPRVTRDEPSIGSLPKMACDVAEITMKGDTTPVEVLLFVDSAAGSMGATVVGSKRRCISMCSEMDGDVVGTH